jgi:5'-3' exonuclease
MPAIDIADEAFDLLFYTYKRNRWKWLKDEKGNASKHPYLTNAGQIVSGKRLERFFTDLGKHEDPYYDNKKRSEEADLKRLRKSDRKAGRDSSVPPDAILAAKEEWDRTSYVEMLMSISEQNAQAVDGFKPVSSSRELFAEFDQGDKKSKGSVKGSSSKDKEYKFQPDSNEELDEGFMNRMGTLFRNSLSNTGEDGTTVTSDASAEGDSLDVDKHVADLKGRYYYEKFNFSPLDAEKHIALRKSYIEGLVWNLQYYYKGCASWDWFYPYHYGKV